MERMLAKSGTAANAAGAANTERLLEELRSSPLFRQLVPMEAGIGWPIPLRRNGKVYLTLPLFSFGVARGDGNRIELHPPFASVTVAWATGRPVKYVSFAYERPWPEVPAGPVGVFPHDAIATLSIGEYRERRAELLGLYDGLCTALAGGEAFSAERSARFSELLRLMVEPSLEPFYRALGKSFFERFLTTSEKP
jgi:hypothetical protein